MMEVDVPADGSCLFWAATLAYLVPAQQDAADFQNRFKKLFGITQNMETIQILIKGHSFDSNNSGILYLNVLLKNLVQRFRQRVMNYVSDHKSEFEKSVIHYMVANNDEFPFFKKMLSLEKSSQDFDEKKLFEHYLEKMHSLDAWGGEIEIKAMSELLEHPIEVVFPNQQSNVYGVSQGNEVPIRLFHVCASGNKSANHYHFGLNTPDRVVTLPAAITPLLQKLSALELKERMEYSTSGMKRVIHGTVYQLKLLMLFAWRAFQQGYPFLLATEMEEAEKFDDIVLQREIDGKLVYQVLQAKHIQEKSKNITVKALLNQKDGEFSLPKYFLSYRKIRKNPTFKDGFIKNFTICTNINFDFDQLISQGIVVKALAETEDILSVESRDKPAARYQFIFDTIDKQGLLCQALRKTSNLHLLAKTLAKHILNNNKFGLKDPLLKVYHLALATEVIDIENKKFYDHFINNNQGLSESVRRLREELESSLKPFKKRKNDLNAIDVQKALSHTLSLSNNFGKMDFKLENVQEFAERIADLISENSKEKKRVIHFGMDEDKCVKKNMPKLVNHVLLEQEEKLLFSTEFIDGKVLPSIYLTNFREQLKEKLAKRRIDWSTLRDYRLVFNQFPKLNLIDDRVADEDMNSFFDQLVFAVNQPNEEDLGKLIQQEIGEKFNKMASGFIADAFLREMLDWMKKKTGRFLSHKEARDFFDTAIETLDELTRPPAECLPPHWNLPPKNKYFVGRDALFIQINDHFSQRDKPVILTACHGLGGIGKTQVAIEYVWRYYEEQKKINNYKGICWFNAENKGRLREDYVNLGQQLRILREKEKISNEKQASYVKHWLEQPPRAGWLLIYDNASQYGGVEGIGELLPIREGKLLVTSRYTEGWPQERIAVDIFEPEESRKYIQIILGSQLSESDRAQIDLLAETLGRLPLALAQACAYINKNKLRIARYLNLYETKKKVVLSDETLSENTLQPDSNRMIVYITWDITMDKIRIESPLAENWLNSCAYLANSDIPDYLLETFAEDSKNNPNSQIYEEARGILNSYSMLTINEQSHSASIHRLVQEVIRLKRGEEEKMNDLTTLSILLLYSFPYDGKSLADYAKKRQLLPHLEAFLKHLEDWQQEVAKVSPASGQVIDENIIYRFLSKMAHGYSDLGYAQKQRDLLERALSILKRQYGPIHPNMAINLGNLGTAYIALGDAEKARSLFEQALKLFGEQNEVDHPEVARTLSNVGTAYMALGDAEKARGIFERALLLLGRYHSPDHPDVMLTLTNLGNAHGAIGDASKQRELLERALPLLERHYGHDHPHVAITLMNLGSSHGSLGNAQKQRELLERALPLLEEHYGSDHPNVARTLTNLVVAYRGLGEFQIGLDLLERALHILEKHFGSNHPEVARAIVNLSNVYGAIGEAQKQCDLLEQALLIFNQHYGPNHPETARNLMNLGEAYKVIGETEKGRDLLEQALPVLERHYGSDHPEVARALTNQGTAYRALGDAKKACKLLERALNIAERNYGDDHQEVGRILTNLGVAYETLEQTAKALNLQIRALDIAEKHYGPEHAEVASILTNLGGVYRVLGEANKGRELLERALLILEKHYGHDHHKVASTLTNLGVTYNALGDAKKSRDMLKRALSISKKYYKQDHLDIGIILNNLGIAYKALGDATKACDFFERSLTILKRHYGSDHPEIAKSQGNLGGAYLALGCTKKARDLFEQSLLIFEQYYSTTHQEVVITLMNLGKVYMKLDQAKQACEVLERALPLLEIEYGSNHPAEMACTLLDLSKSYLALRYIKKACDSFERALPILEQQYGPEHPKVAITLTDLGAAYGSLGQIEKAQVALERALSLLESHHASDISDVALALMNLGAVYATMGRAEEARVILERALLIFEKQYGLNHPDVARTLTNLSGVYKLLGDAHKERDVLERALTIKEMHHGNHDRELVSTLTNLGIAYALMDAQKACGVLERALTITKLCYDPNSPEEIQILEILNKIKILVNTENRQEIRRNPSVIEQSRFPLHEAANSGNLDVVKSFIDKGDDIEAADQAGYAPLHLAVKNNRISIIQILLQHGAVFNKITADNKTPLDIAKQNHQEEAIRLLDLVNSLFSRIELSHDQETVHILRNITNQDERQAVTSACDRHGRVLLHYAAQQGCLKVVKFLLEQKFNGNIVCKNKAKWTPLHYAAKRNHLQIVSTLLKHGAIYIACDYQSRTPLQLTDNPEIKELLTVTDKLFNCVREGNLNELTGYLNQEVAIHACDNDGRTLLHIAAQNGHLEVIKALLQKNLDVNALDNDKQTPLQLAVQHNHFAVFKILLE